MKRNFLVMFLTISIFIGFGCSDQLGSTEFNVTLNESGEIDYEQIDYSVGEFEVVVDIPATQNWAEVQLNTSEINFGHIEEGTDKTMAYKIWARGSIDIEVRPTLTTAEDEVFSKLYFSRTEKTNYKKIGEYIMRFNLTENKSNWLGIGSSNMEPMKPDLITNGRQYIKLDLTNFREIIPFEETRKNKVKFVITPIWSDD